MIRVLLPEEIVGLILTDGIYYAYYKEDERLPSEFSDLLYQCISENSPSVSKLHPESTVETNDEWDNAFTEAPVRVHPKTEEYFKQKFKLIKK